LVTANFLHDSFIHLAASCYALYTLAPEVEAVLGYSIFAAVYLLAGLAGSTACFVFTDSITVGASGSLFGLIGVAQGPTPPIPSSLSFSFP
jgi:rhomboid protease GluP